MLDFEELSAGRTDFPANKYYSSVNGCASPSIMDMLLNANDSLSFQEILDLDIKNEIDTVLGSHNDFTSFNFSDLPPLDLEEPPSDINMWFTSATTQNSNFNIDFIGSEAAALMVNPNSVMPLTLVTESAPKALSKSLIKPPPVIKLSDSNKTENDTKKLCAPIGKSIKLSTNSRNIIRDVKSSNSLLNIKSTIQKQLSSNSVKIIHGRKQQFNNNRVFSDDVKVYPKPAYSYSCLIAMSLKNSRNGSLPVSEIYNFMCEHFPYFKTAPNGWKNSVRHNLSLNKCFEKIEKPAVSGAQRKGCLWAMNPAKITKMDEEVQKWSRKDPAAIRKAMTNPEHLELLEKGELKYSSRNNCDDDEELEEEYDDVIAEDNEDTDVEVEEAGEVDLEDVKFIDVAQDDMEGEIFDIEVGETFFTPSLPPTIKIEMELVDDAILSSSNTKKRNRSLVEIDDNFGTTGRIYQLQAAPTRRKISYQQFQLVKND